MAALSFTYGVLQLSTVCTQFAEAAAMLPSWSKGLNLDECYLNLKLGSALLLRWAGRAQSMRLGRSLELAGLNQFIAAAVNMSSLRLETYSFLEPYEADEFMPQWGYDDDDDDLPQHVQHHELAMQWCVLSSELPNMKLDLRMDLYDSRSYVSDEDASAVDDSKLEALLCKLSKLPNLQNLYLSVDFVEVPAFSAFSPALLTQISTLTISVQACQRVTLGWLRSQPCPRIHVHVDLDRAGLLCHRAIADGLRGVKLESLRFCLSGQSSFSMNIQRLWSRLTPDLLEISVKDDAVQNQVFWHLQALPRCDKALLHWECVQKDLSVSWAALTQAANFSVTMAAESQLHVLGADLSALENLQRPWQLTVHGAAGVVGLPASEPLASPLVWQNSAARAAGWNGKTSLDWIER